MNHVSNRSSNSPTVDERHLMFDDLEKLGRILVETGDIAHSFVQGRMTWM